MGAVIVYQESRAHNKGAEMDMRSTVPRTRWRSLLRRTASAAVATIWLAGCVSVLEADEGRTGLMFSGDFESDDMRAYGDSQPHTFEKTDIVHSPVRAGRRALRVTLDRGEHREINNHRTDFWIRGMSTRFEFGREYWYGFSTYKPADWTPDPLAELFVQWVPGPGAQVGAGGPCLAIYLYGNEYRVRRRWGAGMQSYRNLWSGPVDQDLGRWVDWVFRVRWSATDDGTVTVWKNGEQIVADQGRNSVAGDYAPYFKFGIYKWPWKRPEAEAPSPVSRRVMFFDEIRIADDSGSYQTVSPP